MNKAKKPKPEGKFRLVIGGHTLAGTKHNGAWTLSCLSWPELAEQHSGVADASAAIEEFTARATGTYREENVQ